MAPSPDRNRRRQLLDTLVEQFAVGGVGDRSLRDVAAAVGTSHRMLLHYFGSRESMLVAIVNQEPASVRQIVGELPAELDRIAGRCLRKDQI